ncbi:hypothetical protein [Arcanobacterium canis]
MLRKCSAPACHEPGNATVGFVATIVMLLAVTYFLLSTVTAWYIHGIARDCAFEGARLASLDGNSLDIGRQRARELLVATLGPHLKTIVTGEENGEVMTLRIGVDYLLPSVLGTKAEVSASVRRE